MEILEFLVNFLCQMNTQPYCWDFINSYYDPVQQIVFFVFFPGVFIILFVYFMTQTIMSEHKGLRTLLGLAIFMFIVFQGWYYVFLAINKLWYIFHIILGGIGVVAHKMSGKRQASKQLAEIEKAPGGLFSFARRAIAGNTTFNPSEIIEIKNKIKGLTERIKKLKGAEKGLSDREKAEYEQLISQLIMEREDLLSKLPPGIREEVERKYKLKI